ncbi:MAG: cytochrome b [Caldimonas sp.]
MTGDEERSYGPVAIALHWLIGFALLGQISFGFLLDEIAPRGTPARAGVINLHKSIGIVLGLLIVVRLAWRVLHRPLAWPGTMPAWQRRAAMIGHRALYACMVLMPLAGYTASNFSKHGIKFFGTTLRPWGPDLPQVYAIFNGLHIATAFVFCILIAGHVIVALKHALIDHDGVFARMLPGRSDPGPPSRLATSTPRRRTSS